MSLKNRVLSVFRQLHRTRETVFHGDEEALKARVQINSEFKKNKHVTDASEIQKLIQIAEESEKLLRTEVVQGRRVGENTYQVVITKDTLLGENTIFKDDAVLPARGRQRKCSDKQDITP
ncbi:complex III assembly factor LYRM7-like isoform X3 [Liolophura sinensis]|uniref:complex III assembly factor LYRM7-like isoform X3 n=1 Tax=Liolophura sinensis TaxID=3198878 RepID=UPI0031596479